MGISVSDHAVDRLRERLGIPPYIGSEVARAIVRKAYDESTVSPHIIPGQVRFIVTYDGRVVHAIMRIEHMVVVTVMTGEQLDVMVRDTTSRTIL